MKINTHIQYVSGQRDGLPTQVVPRVCGKWAQQCFPYPLHLRQWMCGGNPSVGMSGVGITAFPSFIHSPCSEKAHSAAIILSRFSVVVRKAFCKSWLHTWRMLLSVVWLSVWHYCCYHHPTFWSAAAFATLSFRSVLFACTLYPMILITEHLEGVTFVRAFDHFSLIGN